MKRFFYSILCAIITLNCYSGESDNKNAISFNAGYLALVGGIAYSLKDVTGKGLFLPFHLTYQRRGNSKSITELDLIYRYDNHGTFAGYNEFLVMFGKRFYLGKSQKWTWGLKTGLGYVSGPVNNKALDEFGNIITVGEQITYSCLQGAVAIDIKRDAKLSENWSFTYGGGALFIIPVSCENTPEWSTLGIFVHRTVPVVDLSFKYNF